MHSYQNEFIEFLVQSGVLAFGDFVTKSGRQTPYFVNTGLYRTGAQLSRLGQFYAAALGEYFGNEFDNLYGPAYKGISLAVTTAIALSQNHSHDISVTYNRKESKDHGEKGTLIGHPYDGSERIVIIEDVITAGTSVRETMALLSANHRPDVRGVIVSVDRMERGSGTLTAIEEIKKEFNLDVFSIVNVRQIITHLHNRPIEGKIVIGAVTKRRMEEYLATYGA